MSALIHLLTLVTVRLVENKQLKIEYLLAEKNILCTAKMLVLVMELIVSYEHRLKALRVLEDKLEYNCREGYSGLIS